MMNSRDHNNNFNLVRLIAALQVLAVHSMNHFGVTGIFADFLKAIPGVPIFFFISGCLIGQTYKKNHERGPMVFFKNRFLRIYPGLIICVFFSIIAVAFTGFFHDKDIGIFRFVLWIFGQISVFQFYNPDFMRSFGVGVLNGALWTISVEVQFYLLVPLLFFLIDRRPRLLVVVFILSIAANLFLRNYPENRSLPMKFLAVSFLPWIYMFLSGFIIAFNNKLKALVRRSNFIYIMLAYVVSMNFIGGYTENAQNSINPISFFLLAGLILKLATAQLPLPPKVASYIKKSDFSYGLYLYHMPVINILLFFGLFPAGVNIFIAVVISAIAAFVSWYFVEKPALDFKRY
jgi:peptidoglycan/LPS O-acetylase OafA/YrhL